MWLTCWQAQGSCGTGADRDLSSSDSGAPGPDDNKGLFGPVSSMLLLPGGSCAWELPGLKEKSGLGRDLAEEGEREGPTPQNQHPNLTLGTLSSTTVLGEALAWLSHPVCG